MGQSQSQSAENPNGESSRRRRRNSFSSGENDAHHSSNNDKKNSLDRHSDHIPRSHSRSLGNLASENRGRTTTKGTHLQKNETLKSMPSVEPNPSPKQGKLPQTRRNMSSRIRRAMGRKRGSKRKSKQDKQEGEITQGSIGITHTTIQDPSPVNQNLSEEEPPSLISMEEMPSSQRFSYVDAHGDSSEDDEDSEDSSVHSPSFASERSNPPSLTDYASPPQQRHRTIELSTPSSHTSTERDNWGLPSAPISPPYRAWPLSRGSPRLHSSPPTNNRSSSRSGLNAGHNRHQRHYEDSLAGSSVRSTDTAATAAAANHSSNHDSVDLDQLGALPLETPPALKDMNNASFDSTATPPIPPPPPLSNAQASPQQLSSSNQQQQQALLQYSYNRRASIESTISTDTDLSEGPSRFNAVDTEFFPRASRRNEWMGRSIESLILGYSSPAPILALEEDDETVSSDQFLAFRRRSTASTFGGRELGRRSSQGSFAGGRRGSLSLMGNVHGGTLANYYSHRRRHQQQMNGADFVDRSYNERVGRRGSTTTTGPMFRRRSSMATTNSERSGSQNLDTDGNNGNSLSSNETANNGPNVIFSLLARESTGKPRFGTGIAASQALRAMGGNNLFGAFDKPAAGIATEVGLLTTAINSGDWTETTAIISRLAPRLTADPMTSVRPGEASRDANTPPQAPKFYAGGGRLGLERDAFCLAGGVQAMIRMFKEKSFVGQEMSITYDARSLSHELVTNRLASCWNEALIVLRDLVYAVPSLVDSGVILDNGDFLPFLFTLLVHDSCFEAAAALIEEILSMMSQAPQQTSQMEGEENIGTYPYRPTGRITPASTFYLGNVPDVYSLWKRFNCRQLAHFCRILALLVFEPEDRQLLESPTILKSIELLQLRRNRAVRAGRDSTVDMNQSIVLGDGELLRRLIQLLTTMNYAPPIRRVSPYHIMAHNPFIVDTLLMLGFSELESWDEIDRQDSLARDLLHQHGSSSESKPLISRLGSIADWLEDLSETMSEEREASNQILRIMTSAQQAGLVVGSRNRRNRYTHGNQNNRPASSESLQEEGGPEDGADLPSGGDPVGTDGVSLQGLASIAGMLTDQILVRRLYQSVREESFDQMPDFMTGFGSNERQPYQHPIQTDSDAANNLQFNAMILGPYQIEALFVLCTLLGGRRKLDAQDQLQKHGLIPVMEEMFERLPWFKNSDSDTDTNTNDLNHNHSGSEGEHGIHGPGCECTPESALCVQYLRLLHNFCDRDCDNYWGRQLLLSKSERDLVFNPNASADVKPEAGLLIKIIGAFMGESDESPYRFWLASCIESYLRGSSPAEQLFVAKSGLLNHLVQEVSSERLHCAGSLQTSFDLLGELGKGNSDVFRLLVSGLDEDGFRRLMSVAASNLVDSNVFIRSLLLSLERLSASNRLLPLHADLNRGSNDVTLFDWSSMRGSQSRSYLTHSWWDAEPIPLSDVSEEEESTSEVHFSTDDNRSVDWFPDLNIIRNRAFGGYSYHTDPIGLEESIGHYGWLFSPAGDSFSPETYLPSVERLCWFLAANQGRLLRDLLGVVDLRNINHENICCLNTAVVITIFAHRRQQLASLLQDLKRLNDDEQESNRRVSGAAQQEGLSPETILLESMSQGSYSRRASLSRRSTNQQTAIGDRTDILRNFREVLWFWREYYTHRGRDRLSLEFSSHLRFEEWDHVVSLLAADDGSPASLVPSPTRLPRSPYQRSPSARIAENPLRAE